MITSHPWSDDDHLHEECGVFGVFGGEGQAAPLVALGLHALQHRGQEAAGIISFADGQFHCHRALGLVGDIFSNEEVVRSLSGNMSIGHVRYSTTGETALRNVQPLYGDFAFGGVAIAHNGNLTNALTLKHDLVQRGSIFQSSTDTEVLIHLVAMAGKGSFTDNLVHSLKQVEGAYSLIALTQDSLIGVRDPSGVRPLVLGRLGEAYILASESCALDIIGATFERDVKAGEMLVITKNGIESLFPFAKRPARFCIFEYIYFARPDSVIDGKSVYNARKRIGHELALESPVEADLVVPVPDSGVPAAIGYAAASGIPFELGIIRNHYVGRTFIEPTDQIRHLGVKLKHNANRAHIDGKRVILVDDSIVRGTTSVKIVDMIRSAGAKEVHMRIASPPTTNPCFYGVDTPSRDKLLAAQHNLEAMRQLIKVDGLAFISMDGLYRAMGEAKRHNEAPQYCDACFTGEYPLPLIDQHSATTNKSRIRHLEQRRRR